MRADSLAVHYQLWSAPRGVNPEEVDVQVGATANQNGFQVCLSHLDDDGTSPAGTYRTHVLVTYFLGAFDASEADGTDELTPLMR